MSLGRIVERDLEVGQGPLLLREPSGTVVEGEVFPRAAGRQDGRWDRGIDDEGEADHGQGAAGTGEGVDVEDATDQLRPAPGGGGANVWCPADLAQALRGTPCALAGSSSCGNAGRPRRTAAGRGGGEVCLDGEHAAEATAPVSGG